MNSIFAIATICFRTALRSRVVVLLLGFILLAMIGLPLSIESDGTAAGYVRILVTYTLGVVGILLSIVTLWAGCAAVSDEIMTKQIHLVLTKPVTFFQVWAGKWLGLMMLNSLLLACAGVTLVILLWYNPRHPRLSAEQQTAIHSQLLVAHQVTEPNLPDVEHAVETAYQRWLQQYPNTSISPEQVKEHLRQQQWTRALSAPEATKLQVTFSLPPNFNRSHPLYLEYRFDISVPAPLQVPHHWSIYTGDSHWKTVYTGSVLAGQRNRIALPASTVQDDGTLHLSFKHSSNTPMTVLFSPNRGINLLSYDGPFSSNLVRALLTMLFQLGFLTALGVTTGSLFSLPVAVFATLSCMVLLTSAPYMESIVRQPTSSEAERTSTTVFNRIIQQTFYIIHGAVSPLQSAKPLEKLGVGEAIPWNMILRSFVIRILLYGGVCALLGSCLFRQREMGAAV